MEMGVNVEGPHLYSGPLDIDINVNPFPYRTTHFMEGTVIHRRSDSCWSERARASIIMDYGLGDLMERVDTSLYMFPSLVFIRHAIPRRIADEH